MNFVLHVITIIAISLPNILGYNLVFGRGKLLFFAPLALSVVSTYGIYLIVAQTGSYALGIPVGLGLSFALALFFAWLSYRLEPDGLAIMSIAVHLALLAVVLNWSDVTRGALGIPRIPRMPGLETLPRFAVASIVIATAWIFFVRWLDQGPLGRKLQALAENPWHAQAMGIGRKQVYALALLVCGLGACITNILYPQYVQLAHPSDLAFSFTIFMVMCIITGGPGSVIGVTVSTATLYALKEALRFLPLPLSMLGPLRVLIFGVILIVAIYVRRKNLFPVQRTI